MRLSQFLCVGMLALSLSLTAHASSFDAPEGFKDPALLARVMKGEIVIETKVDTKKAFRTVTKAFYKQVSPELFIALAVNHAKYPSFISDIKEAKTTKVSDDKNEYDYWFHMQVKVGFFTQKIYPEGHQKITHAKDAVSEARINNTITNYADNIASNGQNTRLIPYEGGILVEDDVAMELHQESAISGIIKQKFKEYAVKYITEMRRELKGND